MSLEVWTARLSYSGPDRLDITRAHETQEWARRARSGAGSEGGPFAPSWRIVNEAKKGLARALRLKQHGRQQEGDQLDKDVWGRYRRLYIMEMRTSYTHTNRQVWIDLLARPRVTLVCFCLDSHRCHRSILANILGQFGANVRGEVDREPLLSRNTQQEEARCR